MEDRGVAAQRIVRDEVVVAFVSVAPGAELPWVLGTQIVWVETYLTWGQ